MPRGALCLLAALACLLIGAGCGKGADQTAAYVTDLGSSDSEKRDAAINALVKLGPEAQNSVEAVVEKGQDPRQVAGAVSVLAKSGTQRALDLVAARIGDPQASVRHASIMAVADLARVDKSRSVALLAGAMDDRDASELCIGAAAIGLASLSVDSAVAALEENLRAGGVRAVYAAEALLRMGRLEEEARAVLLGSLSSGADPAQKGAAVAVVMEKDLRLQFIPPLVDLLQNQPGAAGAAQALERIRDDLIAELGATLIPRLAGQYLTALGRIGDQASTQELMRILQDPDSTLYARAGAAEALGVAATSGSPARRSLLRSPVREALQEFLLESDSDTGIRMACAISLCRMQEAEGVDFLLKQLAELDSQDAEAASKMDPETLTELRIRAQEALTSSGEFVVPALIQALKNPQAGDITRWAVAKSLGDLRAAEGRPHLIELLTATVPASQAPGGRAEVLADALGGASAPVPRYGAYVLQVAAVGLGRIGGRGAGDALEQAEQVHERTLNAMKRYAARHLYEQLVPVEIRDEAARASARNGLAQMCDRIIQEQEAVLFYIRQARTEL